MTITLDPVVTGYLTSVKNSLTLGEDLGSNVRGAAQNYLRAQDMSSVLELLQEALSATTPLTVAGTSTSTTIVDGAATFVANSQVGNIVTFGAATATVALRGVQATIRSNSTTTLTLTEALPGVPVSTPVADTYTIRAAFLDGNINALRQGASRGENPPGSVYGDVKVAIDGLVRGILQLGGSVPSYASDMIQVHPGGQPGDNARLANLIAVFQAAVVASTVPT